jgi:hypothetical protein
MEQRHTLHGVQYASALIALQERKMYYARASLASKGTAAQAAATHLQTTTGELGRKIWPGKCAQRAGLTSEQQEIGGQRTLLLRWSTVRPRPNKIRKRLLLFFPLRFRSLTRLQLTP